MADGKDSFNVDAKSSGITASTSQQRPLFMAQDILRILAILLSAASIAVNLTNNQTVTIFGFQFEAHYYYSSSFKFLVAANAIVLGFSVLMLIINNLLLRGSQRRGHYFFLFLLDIVMTVLLISGCAAATAIGYVGQFGESHMGWPAICDNVKKFCRRGSVSLLLSYLAFFAYLGLTIFTAYKCMSSSPKN